MLTSSQIYCSEAVIESLNQATAQLQLTFVEYSPEQIEQALLAWFESTIESLAEDALFHVAEGRSDLAIGRTQFNKSLAKYAPQPIPQSYSPVSA